ncbi:hypothetical protein [Parafrankia sp. EAN1pec]|uniref:hypothetical protein n=1 Tax=Parafrankia sp. (strain EAN1pec) TaxID=298653 RepID=UPI0003192F66
MIASTELRARRAVELPPERGRWTAAQLRALPVTTDLATAGSVLDMGLTKARELARAGQFPVPVVKHGERYVVPTRPLLALLGVEPGEGTAA